jgi:hypothetical protein
VRRTATPHPMMASSRNEGGTKMEYILPLLAFALMVVSAPAVLFLLIERKNKNDKN